MRQCYRNAHHLLIWILAATRSELKGRGGLRRCYRNAHHLLIWIFAVTRSELKGQGGLRRWERVEMSQQAQAERLVSAVLEEAGSDDTASRNRRKGQGVES